MTQEIIKIVGIEVQMPYHNEVYIVGEKPEGHGSMIVKNAEKKFKDIILDMLT